MLYLALMQHDGRKVQVEEIAEKLGVPRHFMGKIMKQLVQEGLLVSVKGPYGGFSLSPNTLQMPLYRLVEITDGLSTFDSCVLRLRACSAKNPCPIHFQMAAIKKSLQDMLLGTVIADLIKNDKEKFIQSIATEEFGVMLDKLVTDERTNLGQ